MRHINFSDFEIQTDHLMSAEQPNLVIINKKKGTCQIVAFVVLVYNGVKIKESEKRNKYLDRTKDLKKAMENVGYTDANCYLSFWNDHQRLVKGIRFRKQRVNGDYPLYSLIKIGHNSDKSPADPRRLTVRDNQLTMV